MAISIKKSLFLAAALVFSSFLFSQNDVPRFRGLKNEISIYFLSVQSFASSYAGGKSFVFKHQVRPFRGEKWSRSAALRFSYGFFRKKDGYEWATGINLPSGPAFLNTKRQVFQSTEINRVAQIGFEFCWQKKYFGHWFGADLGYRWGRGESLRVQILNVNGLESTTFLSKSSDDFYALGSAFFWGCRRFLSKRLSFGLEIGLPIEYEFSSVTLKSATFGTSISSSQFWEYPFSRPRFLFLAFHF